jgi:hypothetical protein
MKSIIVFISILFFLSNIFGCKKDDTGGQLSPARDITGLWMTTFPVTFYFQTDFCTPDLIDVATEERTITWEIEEIDDNNVLITINFTNSNFTVTTDQCPNNNTGVVPDVPTDVVQGVISSSGMRVTEFENTSNVLGEFTFTTDLMQGTWDVLYCIAYCQRVYTLPNEYKLIRQN